MTQDGVGVIAVSELRKSYGSVEAVRGVSFEVAPGEVFALLGPNGAGKTTTVEILEGLLAPDAGEVEVLGRGFGRDAGDLRQRLGIQLPIILSDTPISSSKPVSLSLPHTL